MKGVQSGQSRIKKFAFHMHKFAYLNKAAVLIHLNEPFKLLEKTWGKGLKFCLLNSFEWHHLSQAVTEDWSAQVHSGWPKVNQFSSSELKPHIFLLGLQ